MVGITSNYERIMEANEFHNMRENVFVIASSYTVPKGSVLGVSNIN